MKDIAKQARRYTLIILIHLGVVVIWQLWVTISNIPDYVMPSPGATVLSLAEDYGWLHNTYITAVEVFGGYFLAVIAGVSMALIFNWFRLMETLFMPLMVSLNMIPTVAVVLAVSEVTFDVKAGELVSIVGPSGCGKTTILKILAGIHS